jgi:DNA integrity scanning protein DisA with diadenylate cyclase activity
VLVVSEETAAISLARRGQLMRDLTPGQVRSSLCPPTS